MRHISPKIRTLIRFAAFLLVFALLLGHVQKILTHSDLRAYQWIHGFYDEEEDSLDAVYIGSSATYAFWNSLYGWKNYGITVYPYTSPAMPILDLVDMVKDIRKTQPNALIIVGYSTVDKDETTLEQLHYLVDYMPLSGNKMALISFYAKTMGLSFMDTLEFYFPIIRYHDRWPWSSLDYSDFTYANNGLKGASCYSVYLDGVKDASEGGVSTDEIGVLPDEMKKSFDDLCAYCNEEGVRLLFVTPPQSRSESNIDVIERFNAADAYLEAKGEDVLDLKDAAEEVGLDLSNDYYNKLHTNIHGSAKYTSYLSKYLIEKYGFTDKRGDPAYASWDEGVALYTEEGYMGRLLDFEQDAEKRDTSLEAPQNLTASSGAGSDGDHVDVTLSWVPSEGADGYRVYLKLSGQDVWYFAGDTGDGTTSSKLIADTSDEQEAAALRSGGEWQGLSSADGNCSVTFSDAERKFTLYYRVVPYSVVNGGKVYGNYSVPGVACYGPDTELNEEAEALPGEEEEILAGEEDAAEETEDVE